MISKFVKRGILQRSILKNQVLYSSIFNQRSEKKGGKFQFNSGFMIFGPIMLYALNQIQQEQENLCEPPSAADKIRGNYENKIRFFSPPEKIFETFASEKDEEGNLVMTYSDFYRAVTPYNHSHIKSNYNYMKKYKKNVDIIMNYADADNNGVISFTEFFFFMTVI